MVEEKDKLNLWNFFLKKEWSYTTGAVLLSLLAISLVIVTNHAWGVTGPFSIWGGKVLTLIGIDADVWAAFNGKISSYSFFSSQASVTNVGIVVGAFISVLLAASFKYKKLKSRKNVAAGIVGGLLMGIGARIALGCNIGNFFSGLPAFSLAGWVFMVFIFIGAAVGSKMLTKWFM